jgi:NosR/NirI family nitrous oxide reductase transcriptional regulator
MKSITILLTFFFSLSLLAQEIDCNTLPCNEVVAGSNIYKKNKINPKIIDAFDGDQFLGHIIKSDDFVDIPAYSGKPVINLTGISNDGKILGIKVIKHSEPILLIGIPEEKLYDYVNQYIGLHVETKTRIGKTRDKDLVAVDGISGATVTVLAEDRAIMEAALIAAASLGIVKEIPRVQGELVQSFEQMSWNELVDAGLIGHLVVTPQDVMVTDPEEIKKGAWIDLYYIYLNLEMAGKNILGKYNYKWIKSEIEGGKHAFLVVANGQSSFKGSGFVRGAIFDRFTFEQRTSVYTFRDTDYHNFSDLEIDGSPEFKEGGIFIINDTSFSPFEPFSLNFLSARIIGAVEREYFIFKDDFMIPSKYLDIDESTVPEAIWVGVWKTNVLQNLAVALFLLTVLGIFTRRPKLALNAKYASYTKYTVMVISLFGLGFYKKAQPSITQLLTLLQGVVDEFRWGLFLSDPLLFIFWWFIFISVVIWGRGVFCGWLCPFGALSELSYNLLRKIIGNKWAFEFKHSTDQKLKNIKYVILAIIAGTSLFSMHWAEKMAEIEPFKTTFLVGLNRQWYFVVYFVALCALCLVTYRFFCRYMCPLGAALAIPSHFSFLGIKRRDFCTKCRICAKNCHVGAINERGEIDKKECLYCMDCEVTYSDNNVCPVLIKDKRARIKLEKEQNK